MKKLSALITIIFVFNTLTASTLDSLQNLLQKYSNDPNKSLKIIEQIYNLTAKSNPQLAIELTARAIYLTDSILQNKELSAQWKFRLAKIYLDNGILDQATRYLTEVRDFYKNRDPVNYAKALLYLGEVYYKLKVPAIAYENYTIAEKIFKKHNEVNLLALTRTKLAQTLYDDYQVSQAFNLLYNTLDSFQLNQLTLAEVYKTLAKLYWQDEELDSALNYYYKAIEIYKNNPHLLFDYALTLYNTALILIDKQNYQQARQYLQQALKIFQQLDAQTKIASVLNAIANSYFKQNNYDSAIFYFLKSNQIAQLSQYSQIIQDNYLHLAKIYEQQKQLDKALNYYKNYIEERNKFFERLTSQSYASIILMFQNEEKQREIEILKHQEKLKTQQLRFSLIVIALLLILILVIVLMMQKLRKANKLLEKQYQQIQLQKRELQIQSKILEKATRDLLAQKEKIEKQNRAISSSIKYASRIQKAMLPKPEIFAQFFDEFFIFFKPKETVSGDFYWIAEIPPEKPTLFSDEKRNNVIVAVADCTGHGVPGAFMAMLGDAYLNQIIKVQHIYEPDKILEELNKNIRNTLHQEDSESMDGMDIAIAHFDFRNRIVKFAGAKMDLVYIQNDKIERIHGDMFSIGGLKQEKDKKFTVKSVDFTTETIFYMYSDGFQDQFGGKYGRKYMAKNFRQFLYKIHNLPMDQQKQELEKELKRWKGKKYPQMDDITVIGLKVKGKYD